MAACRSSAAACGRASKGEVGADHPKAGVPSFFLFSLYFEEPSLTLPSTVVRVDERRQCLALSARRLRRRRAAVLQRKGQAMKMAFIDVEGSLLFSFLFQGALFDAVLDRLSSSEDAVGGACSVLSYLGILPAKGAGSALGASRAPPAPPEPCRFSPLAASSAGGLGAASEAAPVRPYPKTTSSEDQRPCASEHRRGNPLFCRLVSAVRCAVVGRCLSWCPLGLS